ncbi:MAG: phospho-N-acetylmuramoyl-pentapeptide-transferase, partial [Cryomorphaceae bacterium]|nr:phospho-N-acetylmuramoyl-pentapeptide-transferase [Cryomorphaceae bacterium]
TPTMGGLIILGSIIIPTLLFARLDNIYIILLLVTTIWTGLIGFLDDYIKVFKKDKQGLKGKFKVIGQVGLGAIVGSMLYFHPDVTIRQKATPSPSTTIEEVAHRLPVFNDEEKSTKTTIPFVKNNELDYSAPLRWINPSWGHLGWIIFIPLVIFIVTAVSNGANLTDGLDGLATGVSAVSALTLGIFAYVSGSVIFADYLNIMYIPRAGEITVFVGAMVGACVGFLWYNAYPAQVFMGDTGSLALGGIIAVLALATRKELLIPILCGVFLVENLSVIVQVSYFKYTKKKYGEGRRVFLMAPLHHHYQKKGYHEAKIVTRMWIVAIMLAILTFVTLKLR